MSRRPRSNQRFKILWVFAAVLLLAAGLLWWRHHSNTGQNAPQTSKSASDNTHFNKKQYPTRDPSSLWVVVNKGRRLPSDYSPYGLVNPNVSLRLPSGSPEMKMRADAASAIEKLVDSASHQGAKLMLVSGYRSYQDQTAIYNRNVANQGQTAADASSARPGYSEHQTGLAADLGRTDRQCELEFCFAETAEGRWLAANAYRFGFVIRYQKDKQSLTGYEYEPWHIRFVGQALAKQLHEQGQTLEQFFNLPTFADYSNNYLTL